LSGMGGDRNQEETNRPNRGPRGKSICATKRIERVHDRKAVGAFGTTKKIHSRRKEIGSGLGEGDGKGQTLKKDGKPGGERECRGELTFMGMPSRQHSGLPEISLNRCRHPVPTISLRGGLAKRRPEGRSVLTCRPGEGWMSDVLTSLLQKTLVKKGL